MATDFTRSDEATAQLEAKGAKFDEAGNIINTDEAGNIDTTQTTSGLDIQTTPLEADISPTEVTTPEAITTTGIAQDKPEDVTPKTKEEAAATQIQPPETEKLAEMTDKETITPKKDMVQPKTEDQLVDFTKITGVEDWKKKTGGGLNNLEDWVEAKYGTIATQEDGKLIADINGKKYQWIIDDAGNPIKTEIGVATQISSGEQLAIDNGISYTKGDNGEITYQPKDFDEYLTIKEGNRTAVIDKDSIEALKATKTYDTLKMYKGASTDTIYNGLTNGDISIQGENWDRLVRMNGGEPTAEMLEARKKWEDNTKIGNINSTISDFNGEDQEETTVEKFQKDLDTFDKVFYAKMNSLYGDMADDYEDFKKGNEETNALSEELDNLDQDILEIQKAKRKVLDDVKKKYPNLSYAEQLNVANEQIDALDDQLFAKQVEYNRVSSSYKTKYNEMQTEYEYATQITQQKMSLATSMYQTGRKDIIRTQDIQLANEKLADERKYNEEQLQASYDRGDEEAAKEYAYKIAILDYQSKLNKEAENTISSFSTEGGAFVRNGSDLTFVPAGYSLVNGEIVSQDGTTAETSTGTTAGLDFSSNQELIDSAPNEASFKNNNPTGLTWGISNNLKNMFDNAGISYEQGTARPSAEGGNYIKFATVEDGLQAYQISLTQAGSDDIYERLKTWVGTDNADEYATSIMNKAGIEKGTKFSELSDNDLLNLMSTQLQRESPAFYNALMGSETTDTLTSGNFVTDRLARNNAIDLFLGSTNTLKEGVDVDLVNRMGNKIQDFMNANQNLVNKFNTLVTGDTATTSDTEQIQKFNKAIAESALGDGDLTVIKDQIKNSLLKNSNVGDDLETAQNISEGTAVIESLVNNISGGTGLTAKGLENLAKTIGKSSGEDITSIDQITGKMLASYVKSISGVAVSEEEYQRLASQLPSIKDDPTRFNTLLQNFKNETVRENTVRARQLLDDDELFYDLFPVFQSDGIDEYLSDSNNETDVYLDNYLGQGI